MGVILWVILLNKFTIILLNNFPENAHKKVPTKKFWLSDSTQQFWLNYSLNILPNWLVTCNMSIVTVLYQTK